MVNALNAAISGLQAASTRLSVSAENIANQQSTSRLENGQVINSPFVPKDVIQLSQSAGGVATQVVDSQNPTQQVFDPNNPQADANGVVNAPNVDLEKETVNQIIAAYDFKANVKVLKVQDELQQSLLDIKA